MVTLEKLMVICDMFKNNQPVNTIASATQLSKDALRKNFVKFLNMNKMELVFLI